MTVTKRRLQTPAMVMMGLIAALVSVGELEMWQRVVHCRVKLLRTDDAAVDAVFDSWRILVNAGACDAVVASAGVGFSQ